MTLALAGLCLLIAAAGPVPAAGEEEASGAKGDWPQYRGPGRDGVSPETGLLTTWPGSGPRELWRVPLGEGFSGIAAVDGRLYTMYGRGKDEYVASLEAATGREVWRRRIDDNHRDSQGNGPRSTPTVEGGVVYVLGARGMLAALKAESGEIIWERDLEEEYGAKVPRWGASVSPLVEGDLLLVETGSSGGRSLMAFDKEFGRVVWASQTDKPGYSSPLAVTVNGTRQILFFTATGLVSVSPEDGSLLWRVAWKTSYDVNAAMPVFLAPDRVFISSGYDVGAAVFRITGSGKKTGVEEIWRSRVMKNHFNSSVLYDGYLYGFDDGTLKCIDPQSGEEKWRQRGFAKGSLLAADGHLIVLGERGQLALAEATPAAYREKGRSQPLEGKTWTMPTVSNGRLYLRNEEELVALDIRSEQR
jgi:outer membrane protein assembly factor BamB